MNNEKFVMISVNEIMRKKLSELKGKTTYNELIESLFNIIKAFNNAFTQVVKNEELLMKIYQQLQVDLDKIELELIEKVVT